MYTAHYLVAFFVQRYECVSFCFLFENFQWCLFVCRAGIKDTSILFVRIFEHCVCRIRRIFFCFLLSISFDRIDILF